MIGFILNLVSSILTWLFKPMIYTYCSIIALYKREWNEYNMNLAIGKDQYGNALSKYLFNQILISKDGYKFGNVDETISSVIGKNKVKGTLLIFGKGLDFILNLLEPNHSIKAIDTTEDDK